MEFVKITSVEDPLFKPCWQLYNYSFPQVERRDECDQLQILNDSRYHLEAIMREGELLGLVSYWILNAGALFIEHIAVDQRQRGGGVGSRVLEEIKGRYSRPIILEIDPIVDEVSRRRQLFYERSGFLLLDYEHLQPPFREGDEWVSLRVMSYPHPFSREEFESFVAEQRLIQRIGID